ncbi:dom [Symbiodinium sp. CCMP2592]|nr:dom [Symbiodinium sp. CCMP2592]
MADGIVALDDLLIFQNSRGHHDLQRASRGSSDSSEPVTPVWSTPAKTSRRTSASSKAATNDDSLRSLPGRLETLAKLRRNSELTSHPQSSVGTSQHGSDSGRSSANHAPSWLSSSRPPSRPSSARANHPKSSTVLMGRSDSSGMSLESPRMSRGSSSRCLSGPTSTRPPHTEGSCRSARASNTSRTPQREDETYESLFSQAAGTRSWETRLRVQRGQARQTSDPVDQVKLLYGSQGISGQQTCAGQRPEKPARGIGRGLCSPSMETDKSMFNGYAGTRSRPWQGPPYAIDQAVVHKR